MKQHLLDDKGRSEEEYLASYKPRDYEKPSITVDMVLLTKTTPIQVLLIKRKHHPFIEQWAFPGGFVNMDEDLDQAAHRELKEETSVDAISLTQLHTYGNVHRDPRMRVISVAYLAILPQQIHTQANDDAKEALWFDIIESDTHIELINSKAHIRYERKNNEIKSMDNYDSLAFDHIQILIDALDYYTKSFE